MQKPGTANQAQFFFQAAGTELRVVEFTATEALSELFSVSLLLCSEEAVAFDQVVGQAALLTVRGLESERYFHGILTEFVHVGFRGRFWMARARIQPSMALLELEQDCRIFQAQSTQEIAEQILQDRGITGDKRDFRLQGMHEPREYCVQLQETDLNFLRRLLEDDGVFYFFEHSKSKHVVCFGDGVANYQALAGKSNKLPLIAGGGMVPDVEFAHGIKLGHRVHTGKATVRDYFFEKPTLDLTAFADESAHTELEVYDGSAGYTDKRRGDALATTWVQAEAAHRDQLSGQSTCPRLTPGFTFGLKIDAKVQEPLLRQEHVVVAVSHWGSQPHVLEEFSDHSQGTQYGNQFTAIPKTVPFRSIRTAHRPRVQGVQTAIVTGPSSEEIHTDRYGRVKVSFHWDRSGKKDDTSSCWLRVSQPWAGQGFGALFLPRVGHEVIVSFIDGNPDRPIVTGQVYHGTNLPPYSLPVDKTKSTIKSRSSKGGGGFNELRFEDKKGQEEIFLHAQRDWNTYVLNSRSTVVQKNQTANIGENKSTIVGKDHTEDIGANMTLTVGADRTMQIGANLNESVGANKTETVTVNCAETIGAAKELTIGGMYQVTVGALMNETVGGLKSIEIGAGLNESIGAFKTVEIAGSLSETIGGGKNVTIGKSSTETIKADKSITAKGDMNFQAKKLIIVVKDEINVKVGKATFVMKKNGDINLEGKKIIIKGSGDVVVKGKKVIEN